MNEEMRQERIEAYLSGSLTETERKNFEEQLATDKDFATEVAMHEGAHEVIAHMRRKDLKEHLQAIDSESANATSPERGAKVRAMPIYQRIAVAASVILVVGFALSIIFNPSLNSPQELAAEYYAAIDIDRMRSGQPVDQQDWTTKLLLAEDLFGKGDYRGAAGVYLDLSDENLIHQEKIQWNLLMSYIADEQFSKAGKLLDLVLSDPQHGFYDEAKAVKSKLGDRLPK